MGKGKRYIQNGPVPFLVRGMLFETLSACRKRIRLCGRRIFRVGILFRVGVVDKGGRREGDGTLKCFLVLAP